MAHTLDENSFRRLFEYDADTNKRVFNRIHESGPFENREEAEKMLAHILQVSRLWYARIVGESTTSIEIWPETPDLSQATSRIEENRDRWLELIDEHANDLLRRVEYENTKGKQFTDNLSDLLHHVIIHGQHHRAQISRILRNGGVEPPVTDYIYHLRNRNDS